MSCTVPLALALACLGCAAWLGFLVGFLWGMRAGERNAMGAARRTIDLLTRKGWRLSQGAGREEE
jgi:hypothetical protein